MSLAKRYVRFRDEVFGGLEETSLTGWGDPMPELQLQSLWFSGAFGTEFTGADGERVLLVIATAGELRLLRTVNDGERWEHP